MSLYFKFCPFDWAGKRWLEDAQKKKKKLSMHFTARNVAFAFLPGKQTCLTSTFSSVSLLKSNTYLTTNKMKTVLTVITFWETNISQMFMDPI